jgi:hypothetical protein
MAIVPILLYSIQLQYFKQKNVLGYLDLILATFEAIISANTMTYAKLF